jgi:hypothetical protein
MSQSNLPSESTALSSEPSERKQQVNLLLLAHGLPGTGNGQAEHALDQATRSLLESYQEQSRLLSDHRCPADRRIEAFLRGHFGDAVAPMRLPDDTLVLDRGGLARDLSLPAEGDLFSNSQLSSYRVPNGVLHNPRNDRRTTKGTFHVAEGGLAIPGDKQAVPKEVYAALFHHAVTPPAELLTLPFTANQKEPAKCFVSLLLRPIVCPEVPGVCPEKTMEVRFFAPGSLVSNLDFVEAIFGNGGDPFLPRNDAALDVEHWTGHTGCVVLAPHLVNLTKKELGLPQYDAATARQRRDGMCWKSEAEKYNDGSAFKITCRTTEGVIVTIIADNYYGYCKKEVKTQISYAANLYGNVEEEHAGGALAFRSYNLGDEFRPDRRSGSGRTFADAMKNLAPLVEMQTGGYAIDRKFPTVFYVPEDARASIQRQQIWWQERGIERTLQLVPGNVYISPSGYKLRMEKHPGAPSWRLIGTVGEGVFCHKPCTVSGGGKSEISKSLRDYMLYGPIFVADPHGDLKWVEEVFKKDYSGRWKADCADRPDYSKRESRGILSPDRSLGSVIKLLNPSTDYTDEYNNWLASVPGHIYAMVFIIKRFYKPEWGDWREHFTVDVVNGSPGHELKLDGRKLVGTYLRVGLNSDGDWRTYKLRQDFAAAEKVQTEDDISASVVVPSSALYPAPPDSTGRSLKFITNCERRLFQRPDDAVHRGLDKQTEADMARADNFISNFEPLDKTAVKGVVDRVAEFDKFTGPMQQILRTAVENSAAYAVSSAHPRLVDGKPSKNPRYLQIRPDLMNPRGRYVAEIGMRLSRGIAANKPVHLPADAVLIGRRNNPAEPAAGIRGLAVYNPIHFQELPELFMDFVTSLTGKSPSTTGAGSEGALTKGPFNALRPIVDLNNALVSFILTGLGGFSTSAGFIGPTVRVDHDISLLIPEVWCRLTAKERDPKYLIADGQLEKIKDFVFEGETILASRLGYRITDRFIRMFFGRVFDNPTKVFDAHILKPETQDMAAFADGVKNITETQKRVALEYFEDGSVEDACPPLKALLSIMAHGNFEGKDAQDAEFRKMFSREHLLGSDWYKKRLATKQAKDIAMWKRNVTAIDEFLKREVYKDEAERLSIPARRAYATEQLAKAQSEKYVQSLVGTLGIDPSVGG